MPRPESDVLVVRPEVVSAPSDVGAFGVVEAPLSTFERLYNLPSLRKSVILVVLALAG